MLSKGEREMNSLPNSYKTTASGKNLSGAGAMEEGSVGLPRARLWCDNHVWSDDSVWCDDGHTYPCTGSSQCLWFADACVEPQLWLCLVWDFFCLGEDLGLAEIINFVPCCLSSVLLVLCGVSVTTSEEPHQLSGEESESQLHLRHVKCCSSGGFTTTRCSPAGQCTPCFRNSEDLCPVKSLFHIH